MTSSIEMLESISQKTETLYNNFKDSKLSNEVLTSLANSLIEINSKLWFARIQREIELIGLEIEINKKGDFDSNLDIKLNVAKQILTWTLNITDPNHPVKMLLSNNREK